MFSDIRTAIRKDPALQGVRCLEVVLYQGLWALWAHRLAHLLFRWHVPFVPRLISQVARLVTGIEIHPGARIGKRFFVDHGAGVVIGETAVIGDDVMLYHGVTLGGTGWWSDAKGAKRHPTLGDRVVVGVGASILGPVYIGSDAQIGAHAVVADDVPAGARVRHPRSQLIPPARVRPGALRDGELDYCI